MGMAELKGTVHSYTDLMNFKHVKITYTRKMS
jgi:hypothetical protein